MRLFQFVIIALALLFAFGCQEDTSGGGGDTAEPACRGDIDCPVGQQCTSGACVPVAAESDAGSGEDACSPVAEVCDGEDNDCDGGVDEGVKNSCGGCATLANAVGDACNTCGGVWSCDGIDAVSCTGGGEMNACGGCDPLTGNPGDSCGECGQLECLGQTQFRCADPGRNACGGCGELPGEPGEACGECGKYACQDDGTMVCNDLGAAACQVTRLIVMGDTGEGNATQYQVAAGAQVRCDEAGGCDAFLMLGDNIYDNGAESADDDQFNEKVDLPYANLRKGPPPAEGEADNRERMPIYVALGNHDIGQVPIALWKVQYYIDYSQLNPWFIYPAEYFHTEIGNVRLASIHTSPLAYTNQTGDEQGAIVEEMLAQPPLAWTIVMGHHPYRSNGKHGNAGAFDSEWLWLDTDLQGGRFREWIDEYVCNRVDFYLSGHDHNRQWFAEVPDIPSYPPDAPNRRACNTHFAVSGAGAKTTEFQHESNTLDFGSEEPGFLFMELHPDRAIVEFCDADGNVEWTKTIQRQ